MCPLELVQSDLCSLISPVSVDGMEYFITFIDDYTYNTMVYLPKSKDEAIDFLLAYEAMTSAHF